MVRLTSYKPINSGAKNHPNCLWCGCHDRQQLPLDKFKTMSGPRKRDRYRWDCSEQYRRYWNEYCRIDVPKTRQHQLALDGINFNSVESHEEESLIWANAHHLPDAKAFSREDTRLYWTLVDGPTSSYLIPGLLQSCIAYPNLKENELHHIHAAIKMWRRL
eukprot:3373341-Amphidinium_carterae.7